MPDLFTRTPTVTEVTNEIKALLEDNFAGIRVEGEISQPKQSRNGHVYFTLKDAGAQLSCVIWSSTIRRSTIRLEHGQQVICTGDIQLYAPHGKYQLIVSGLEQAGLGALQQAYERLKSKLHAEGLFDAAHKKPLPSYPRVIGVITSATGAALQDIINTIGRRYPLVTIKVYHASVQGLQAASELVQAIRYFHESKSADIVIIGRGGGSLEDLWPFNEESVARALFACSIPVISAVGHETDVTIADFVADVRAATPTQAAVIAVPDINELRMNVEEADRRLHQLTSYHIQKRKEKVDYYLKNYALQRVIQKVGDGRHKLAIKEEQLGNRFRRITDQKRQKWKDLHFRLIANDPNEALKRGYTRIWQNEKWVRNQSEFSPEKPFQVEWHQGRTEIT